MYVQEWLPFGIVQGKTLPNLHDCRPMCTVMCMITKSVILI